MEFRFFTVLFWKASLSKAILSSLIKKSRCHLTSAFFDFSFLVLNRNLCFWCRCTYRTNFCASAAIDTFVCINGIDISRRNCFRRALRFASSTRNTFIWNYICHDETSLNPYYHLLQPYLLLTSLFAEWWKIPFINFKKNNFKSITLIESSKYLT